MQNGLAPSSANFPGSTPPAPAPAPCLCPHRIPVALDWPPGLLRAGLWAGRLVLREGYLPGADTTVERGPGFGEELRLGLLGGSTRSQNQVLSLQPSSRVTRHMTPYLPLQGAGAWKVAY